MIRIRCQEFGNILADTVCNRVRIMETAGLIGNVYFYNTNNLRRINLNVRQPDPVTWMYNGNRTAERRAFHLIQVMHTDQRFAVSRIQFYDNLVCQPGNGRGNTNSRRQVNTSVFRNFTCLDNGCTYMSQETGT
jgi:hypothetical protein